MAEHEIRVRILADTGNAQGNIDGIINATERLKKSGIGQTLEKDLNKVSSAANTASNRIASALDKAKAKMQSLGQTSMAKVSTAFSAVSNAASSMSGRIGSAMSSAANKVKSAAESMKASLSDLKDKMNKTSDNLSNAMENLNLGGPGKMAAGVFAATGAAMAALGAKSIQLAGDMQMTKMAFTTMLGSAEEAQSFIKQMQEFAASTPFSFSGVTDAAKKFLAFGFAAKDVIPTLTAVGDAAAGLGVGEDGMQRMIIAMGQIKAKGKASAEELMQLAENGVPAWDILAKKIGVDIPTAMDMVSDGAVDADTTIQALTEGMEQRFGGMMDNMSTTIPGLWSNIEDSVEQSLTSIGERLIETFGITDKMQALADAVGKFADIVKDAGLGEALKEMVPPEIGVAIAAVAGALGGVLVAALVDAAPLIAAVAVAFGSFIVAAAPFIAIGAAIGAAIYLCFQYSEELSSAIEAVSAAFSSLGSSIDQGITTAGEALSSFGNSAVDAFNSVIDFFANLGTDIANAFNEAGQTLNGWGDSITAAFASVGDFFTSLGDGIIQTFSDMGTWITQAFTSVVDAVGNVAQRIVDKWISLGDDLPSRLGGVIGELISLYVNAGVMIIGAFVSAITTIIRIGSKLVTSAAEWATGMASALANGIQALPGIAIDVITAIIDNFYDLLDKAINIGARTAEAIGEGLEALPGIVSDAITGASEWFARLIDDAVETGSSIIDAIGNGILQIPDIVSDAIASAVAYFMSLIDAATTTASETVSTMSDGIAAIPGIVSDAISSAASAGMALVDAAFEWGQGAYNAVKEWISQIPDMVSSFISGITSHINIDFGLSGLSGKIPGFASGGYVTKPTLAMVGEGHDKEMIIPINSSTRSQKLLMQTASMMGVNSSFDTGATRITHSANSSESTVKIQLSQGKTDNTANNSIYGMLRQASQWLGIEDKQGRTINAAQYSTPVAKTSYASTFVATDDKKQNSKILKNLKEMDKVTEKINDIREKGNALQADFTQFRINVQLGEIQGAEGVYAEIEKERQARLVAVKDWQEKFTESTQAAEGQYIEAQKTGNNEVIASALAMFNERKNAEIQAFQDAATMREQIDAQTNEKLLSAATAMNAIKAELQTAYNEGDTVAYMQTLNDQNVAFMTDLTEKQNMMQQYYDWKMEAQQTDTDWMLQQAEMVKSTLAEGFANAIVYGQNFGKTIVDLTKKMVAMYFQNKIEQLAAKKLSDAIMASELAKAAAQSATFTAMYGPPAWLKLVLSPGSGGLATGIMNTGTKAAAKINGFAKGGHVTKPTLAWVGEGRDDEMIVPINNSKRSQGLLAQTAELMGFALSDSDNSFTGQNVSFSTASPVISQAPTLSLMGVSDANGNSVIREGVYKDVFRGDTDNSTNVTATQNIYGDINTNVDADDLFDSFGDMLVARVREA